MKLLILTCLVASALAAPSIRTKRNILPGDARYNFQQYGQIRGDQKPQENEIETANALGFPFRCSSGFAVPVAAPKATENVPDSVIQQAGEAPKAPEQTQSVNENSFTLVEEEPVAVVAQPEASSAIVPESIKSDEQVQLTEEVTKVEAKPEEAASVGVAQSPVVPQSEEAKFIQPQVATGVAQAPVTGFFQPQQPSFPTFPQRFGTKYVQPQVASPAGFAQTGFYQPQQPAFPTFAQSFGTKYVQPQVASPAGFAQTGFFQPQQPSFPTFAQSFGTKYVQPQVATPVGVAQSPIVGAAQPSVAQTQEAKFVQPEVEAPVSDVAAVQTPEAEVAPVAQNEAAKFVQPEVEAPVNDVAAVQTPEAEVTPVAQNEAAKFVQPEVDVPVNVAAVAEQPQQASFSGVAQNQDAKFVQFEGVSSPAEVAQKPELENSQVEASPGENAAPFGTKSAAAAQDGQYKTPEVSSRYGEQTPELTNPTESEGTSAGKPAQDVSGATATSFSSAAGTPTFNTATFPNKFGSPFNSGFGSQVGSTFPGSYFQSTAPHTPSYFNTYDHTKYNPQYQFGQGYNPAFDGYKGNNQYYNYHYNRPGAYDQLSGRPFGFGTYSGQYNQGLVKLAGYQYPVGTSFPNSWSGDYNKNFRYGHPQAFQFGTAGYTAPQTYTSFSTIQQTKTFGGEASGNQEQTVKSPESLVQPTAATFQESASVQA